MSSNVKPIQILIKNEKLLNIPYFKSIASGNFSENESMFYSLEMLDQRTVMLILIYVDTGGICKPYLHANVIDNLEFIAFNELIDKIKQLPADILVKYDIVLLDYAIKDIMFQNTDKLVFENIDDIDVFLETSNENLICDGLYGFIHALSFIASNTFDKTRMELLSLLLKNNPNCINLKSASHKTPIVYLLKSYDNVNADFTQLNILLNMFLDIPNIHLSGTDYHYYDLPIVIAVNIYLHYGIIGPFNNLIKRKNVSVNYILDDEEENPTNLLCSCFVRLLDDNSEICKERLYYVIDKLLDLTNLEIAIDFEISSRLTKNHKTILTYVVYHIKNILHIPLLKKLLLHNNTPIGMTSYGISIFEWLSYKKNHDITNDIIQIFMSHPHFHINMRNSRRETILHNFIKSLNYETYHNPESEIIIQIKQIIRYIISNHNIDINVQDRDEFTPLMICDVPELTQILLSCHDININIEGYRGNVLRQKNRDINLLYGLPQHIINNKKKVYKLVFEKFHPTISTIYKTLGMM